MSLEPIFPPEIEEMIFSQAIQTDWREAKSLTFVAKRVYQWLIPQIYKVVIFHYEHVQNPRPKSSSMSLSQHGHHVRHILLFQDPLRQSLTRLYHTPGECLSWCPNVTDIAIWVSNASQFDKVLLDQLRHLHDLTHLSLDYELLKEGSALIDKSTPLSLPTVTHLELIDNHALFTAKELKKCFPNVTHLALYVMNSHLASMTRDVLKLWKDQMKAVIWYHGQDLVSYVPVLWHDERSRSFASLSTLDDPRVVRMQYGRGYVGTWYEGTNGGTSIWRLAEETIAAREEERKILESS